MRRLFWLSDRQFELIKPHLPYRAAGRRREDDRRIISGIIHVLQSGCRWRDCPPEYGPSTTVYNRYNRWSQKGHWQYLFAALTAALSGTPNRYPSTHPTLKSTAAPAAEKGGFCSGHRPHQGRPQHQSPRHKRRALPPPGVLPDPRSDRRHHGRRYAERVSAECPLPLGR